MKIVFLQQRCFLQTKKHTNPLFDSIIRVCDDNGIDWQVWLTDRNLPTGYPQKNVRKYGWRNSLITAGLLFFNRLCKIPTNYSYKILHYIFKTFKILDNDISLFFTNGLYQVKELSILYPGIKIIEVQHGILYPTHMGYFTSDGTLLQDFLLAKHLIFWLFGENYKNFFLQNKANALKLSQRIETIGDVKKTDNSLVKINSPLKSIVIASQLVEDAIFSADDVCRMKSIYENALDIIYSTLNNTNNSHVFSVIFRHHPRFFNCIDLSDWNNKYPSLIMDDNRDWSEIFQEAKCLLTISSTSAFDAAAYGVPTVIINAPHKKFRNILVEDFNYPLPHLTLEKCLSMDTSSYEKIRLTTNSWYKSFYSTFSPTVCKELLYKAINT
jgi:hypothetical protein